MEKLRDGKKDEGTTITELINQHHAHVKSMMPSNWLVVTLTDVLTSGNPPIIIISVAGGGFWKWEMV